MIKSEKDAPGVIAVPPVIYVGFLAVGIGLDALFPAAVLPPWVQYPVGFALMAAAALVMPFVLREFRKAETSFDVRKPASGLVTSGPYRVSRNPGYLALSLLYTGIAIAVDSPWILGMLIPTLVVMHSGVILREERYLEQKFGEDYRRYKRSVRRWI
ncbi:MAG: methyltransferase family protein [Nitrospiraceae bacterium]